MKIFRLIVPIIALIFGGFILQEFDPTRSIIYDTEVNQAIVMHGDNYYRQSLRASYEYKGKTYKLTGLFAAVNQLLGLTKYV